MDSKNLRGVSAEREGGVSVRVTLTVNESATAAEFADALLGILVAAAGGSRTCSR